MQALDGTERRSLWSGAGEGAVRLLCVVRNGSHRYRQKVRMRVSRAKSGGTARIPRPDRSDRDGEFFLFSISSHIWNFGGFYESVQRAAQNLRTVGV